MSTPSSVGVARWTCGTRLVTHAPSGGVAKKGWELLICFTPHLCRQGRCRIRWVKALSPQRQVRSGLQEAGLRRCARCSCEGYPAHSRELVARPHSKRTMVCKGGASDRAGGL